MVELGVRPGHTVGLATASGAQKECASLLHVFTNAESVAGLEGWDVGSLVTEYIRVNKAPRCRAELTGLTIRSTHP